MQLFLYFCVKIIQVKNIKKIIMIHQFSKITGLFFLLFLTGSIYAQNMGLKPDQRLIEVIGNEKLSQMEESGSFMIAVYNYYLDNMYYISETEPENGINRGLISELRLKNGTGTFQESPIVFENKTFNPYLYELEIPYDEGIYYVIEEGKKYFVVYSRKTYEENLSRYLNDNKIIIK